MPYFHVYLFPADAIMTLSLFSAICPYLQSRQWLKVLVDRMRLHYLYCKDVDKITCTRLSFSNCYCQWSFLYKKKCGINKNDKLHIQVMNMYLGAFSRLMQYKKFTHQEIHFVFVKSHLNGVNI